MGLGNDHFLRDVAHEIRDLGEPGPEECLELGVDGEIIHCLEHAAEPGVPHPNIDGNPGVAHAEPRMTVLSDVVVGATQPAHEEEGEAIARASADQATVVELMEPCEVRLELTHQIIKSLRQLDGGFTSAEFVVGVPLHGRGYSAPAERV